MYVSVFVCVRVYALAYSANNGANIIRTVNIVNGTSTVHQKRAKFKFHWFFSSIRFGIINSFWCNWCDSFEEMYKK